MRRLLFLTLTILGLSEAQAAPGFNCKNPQGDVLEVEFNFTRHRFNYNVQFQQDGEFLKDSAVLFKADFGNEIFYEWDNLSGQLDEDFPAGTKLKVVTHTYSTRTGPQSSTNAELKLDGKTLKFGCQHIF